METVKTLVAFDEREESVGYTAQVVYDYILDKCRGILLKRQILSLRIIRLAVKNVQGKGIVNALAQALIKIVLVAIFDNC